MLLLYEPVPAEDLLAEPTLSTVTMSSAKDFSLHLPKGWNENILQHDRQWIGRAVFAKKGELATKLKMWWYPPPTDLTSPQTKPVPSGYFRQQLFLWMPRKMWKIDLKCPNCKDPPR